MLRRIFFSIVVSLFFVNLYCQEEVNQFIVESFFADNSCENTSEYDINGDLCALIKLAYDINQEIIFSGADIRKRIPKEDERMIYLYIEQWSKSVTISTKGFLPFKYHFPMNLQSGKCYSMSIKVPEEFYLSTVIVSPNPPDASITLIAEDGKITKNDGVSRFEDMKPGHYQIEVEHVDCLTFKDEFTLKRSDEVSLTPYLTDTTLFFTLNVPPFMMENLQIEVNKNPAFLPEEKLDFSFTENKFVTGEAGKFYFRLIKNGQQLFQNEVSVFSDNCPEIKLNYLAFIAPVKESELKIDGKLYDKGKDLYLISDHREENVEVSIPGYSSLEYVETFSNDNQQRKLILGSDFFCTGYGIGFKSDCSKKFYGIKLPFLYSPVYHSMNGFEINIWNAGNRTEEPENGYFNGVAVAGFSVTSSNNFSGVALASFLTSSGGDLNGFALSGVLTTAKQDMNGISIGAINIVQGTSHGMQIGLINYTNNLKGIQLGLLNMIDDGPGGGIPVMPLMNLKF